MSYLGDASIAITQNNYNKLSKPPELWRFLINLGELYPGWKQTILDHDVFMVVKSEKYS